MNDLHWAVQSLLAAWLVVGGVFTLVGAIGLVRLPDFFMRLHSPTKATTLGVGGVLLASMALGWALGGHGLHELLITLFLFVTAPVSANLMAQAALHLRVPSLAPLPRSLTPICLAKATEAETSALTPRINSQPGSKK